MYTAAGHASTLCTGTAVKPCYIPLGCPFKHWDEEHMQQMLMSHGIPHKGIKQITTYLHEHHYQLACQKYFEITHGVRFITYRVSQ